MKRLFVLIIIVVLLVLGGWRRSEYRHQQAVIRVFDDRVTEVKDEMLVYDQLDLGFLSGSLDEISYETKEDPDSYIAQLRDEFRITVDEYRVANLLRVELDIDRVIDSMSLEEQVAQLFIFGIDGTRLSEAERTRWVDRKPGGVIMMGDNVSSRLSEFAQQLQQTNPEIPLLVSIDQEGGLVTRVAEDMPDQSSVEMDELCSVYQERSAMLSRRGINLNYGIVADVTDDVNSFIYPRTFRGDIVAKVTEAIRCTDQVLSTVKHFPGHGGTTADTHQGYSRIDLTARQREDRDLIPRQTSLDADMWMFGHLVGEWMDAEWPATLSFARHQYARDLGYRGLIITDDMAMIAGDYDRRTILRQGLLAGNDLLLYVDASQRDELLDYAIDLVREGVVSQEDVRERLRRILATKNTIIRRGSHIPAHVYWGD